jgi:hypothetical protein
MFNPQKTSRQGRLFMQLGSESIVNVKRLSEYIENRRRCKLQLRNEKLVTELVFQAAQFKLSLWMKPHKPSEFRKHYDAFRSQRFGTHSELRQ